MPNNIVTVYCQHGDERFGALIASSLHQHRQPVLLGNPRAFMAGKRFTETDLNRSYRLHGSLSYESARAREIVTELKDADVVLDIHTTRAKVGKVAIVPIADEKRLKLILTLGFTKIAVMPADIVKGSLIGNVNCGISLEFGSDAEQTIHSARHTAEGITSADGSNVIGQVQIYHLKGMLDNKYTGAGLRNYRYNSKIGGYPFLVGESRYKSYAGFFADRVETVIIGGDDD